MFVFLQRSLSLSLSLSLSYCLFYPSELSPSFCSMRPSVKSSFPPYDDDVFAPPLILNSWPLLLHGVEKVLASFTDVIYLVDEIH